MADPETPDRDDGGAAAVPDPQPDPQPVPERRALIAGVAGLVAGALAKATPAEAQSTVAVFRNLINPVTGTTALLRTNLTAMPLFLAETRRGGAGLASVASITGTTITASALNQDVAVLAMGVGTPGVIARADFTNVTVTAAPYAFDAQVALTAPDQGPLPDAFGGQAKVNVWDLPQDVSFGTKVFGIQAWTGSPPESPATLPTTGPVGFRSTVEFPQADPLTVALTPSVAIQGVAGRADIASVTTTGTIGVQGAAGFMAADLVLGPATTGGFIGVQGVAGTTAYNPIALTMTAEPSVGVQGLALDSNGLAA